MKDKKEHRRRVVKRRTRPQTAPGRLGWLGGGMTSSLSASASVGNDNHNNIHNDNATNDNDINAGSQSSSGEKLLTPRPDCDINNTTSTITDGDTNIDLTEDNSNIINSWACRKCTLINSQSLSVCDACNARRESNRSSSKSNQCDIMLGEEGIINGDDELLGKSKKQKLKAPSSKANNVTNKQQKQKQPHKKTKTTLSSWQSSLLSQHSFSSQSNKNKKSKSSSSVSSFNTSKKKSSSTMSKMRSTNNNMKNTEMWIDKHAPTSTKELCVAPKKIDEVRNFLSSHISYTAYQRKQNQKQQAQSNITTNPSTNNNPWEISINNTQPTPPQTKLMILVGSSGIGKSTMIKTLAREMNIEIITWNDIHVDYNMSHDIDGGGGMAYLPYQSQLHSFEEFLKSGGVGMKSLDLLVDDDDDDDSSFENQSVKRRKGGGKMGNNDIDKEYVGSLILVEEVSFSLFYMLNVYVSLASNLFITI